MQCEMCGSDRGRLRNVRVEGTVMNVCDNCARFGEELSPVQRQEKATPGAIGQRLQDRQRRATPRDALETEEELVEDYGERVRRAREKKGLTREQLADRVSEPVPTISKIEAGNLHPSDRTVKALEKELQIKLMEPPPKSQMPQRSSPGAQRGLTLGDLIKQAQKKGQK
jgi:putative transcription factor